VVVSDWKFRVKLFTSVTAVYCVTCTQNVQCTLYNANVQCALYICTSLSYLTSKISQTMHPELDFLQF